MSGSSQFETAGPEQNLRVLVDAGKHASQCRAVDLRGPGLDAERNDVDQMPQRRIARVLSVIQTTRRP